MSLPLSNGDWSGNNGAGFLTSSDACGGGGADLSSAQADLVHGALLYELTTFRGFSAEQGTLDNFNFMTFVTFITFVKFITFVM